MTYFSERSGYLNKTVPEESPFTPGITVQNPGILPSS